MAFRHESGPGRLTLKIRDEFIRDGLKDGYIEECVANDPGTLSFVAPQDRVAPMYFWQLHSVLGEDMLEWMITSFYSSVLADDDAPWFRDAFADLGGLRYHVRGQLGFWMDVLGGRGGYRPGGKSLCIHNDMAMNVMKKRFVMRWMFHMNRTIRRFSHELRSADPRSIDCMQEFLNFFMRNGAPVDFNVFDFNLIEIPTHPRL